MSDNLVIAGKEFKSRLILGTGRYRTMEDMVAAVEASGTEMITVALRRLDLDDPDKKTILDYIDWSKYQILPNTAGCRTADEALTIARLARAMGLSNWIKLEVQPDARYLLPDPVGTLEAAKTLVDEGFIVLPYIHADPVLAMKLEEVGCATVMPLGSAIGSGRGIHTAEEIQIIIEQATVPRSGRCRAWRPVGRVPGDGDGRRRRPGKHGHRPGRRPHADGGRLPRGRVRRAQGIPGRTHRQDGLRLRQQPRRGRCWAGLGTSETRARIAIPLSVPGDGQEPLPPGFP